MLRVVVVEDQAELLEDTLLNLHARGVQARGAADGLALDAVLAQHPADIVLLDLGLPGEDGTQIALRLRRQRPALGIIMVTARTALQERLQGHAAGADHYLCKPVDMDELAAVIRSLALRLGHPTAPAPASHWVLRQTQQELQAPGQAPLALGWAELRILTQLACSPGQTASRKALVQALDEDYLLYDERRLEAHISRLRRKLAPLHPAGDTLKSLRGKGYRCLPTLRLG